MRLEEAAIPYMISGSRRAELLGATVWVVSPEDSILSKLEWARASGSARQVEDATAVVPPNRGALDLAYLRAWADRLGISAELERILGR